MTVNTFTMTKTEFAKALKALGLSRASQLTAKRLALSIRQIQRLLTGKQQVTAQTELLLKYIKRFGFIDD